ncbi:MAG: methyltransferase domain-containing protein [Planctomycetota bacterium]
MIREVKTVSKLDQRWYPGIDGHWDDALLRKEVLERLRPSTRMLDLGAGAGIVEQMDFRGMCASVCGVDPDPRVASNPYLDQGRIGRGESIPWPEACFDLVVADNVLEHLAEPRAVFTEVARVLAPGGHFVVKTPNRRHYMPLVARATPHAFHRFVNRRRGRASEDTFPTLYRANTPAALRRLAVGSGLKLTRITLHESRPEYMRFNAATYALGRAYERAVNSTSFFAPWRVLIVAVLEKPA